MRRLACAAAAVAAVLSLAGPARADEVDAKRQCASEHESSQRRLLDGQLREARASATACAREACPALVRAECTRILGEIEAALPSVVLDVQDGDARAVDVSVEIDGAAAPWRPDGEPIPSYAGEHVIRVTAPDGRSAEARVVLRAGEKQKRVSLALLRPKSVTPRLSPGTAPSLVTLPPPPHEEAPRSAAWPWTAYALGGVGAVGLATFTTFGLMGFKEQAALEASCAPACAPGRDDTMRRDYVVADIGLAVGVLALAGATWIVLSRGAATPHAGR